MLDFLKADCEYCGNKVKSVLRRTRFCSPKCEKQKKEDDMLFNDWKKSYSGYVIPFLDDKGFERMGVVKSFPYLGFLDIEDVSSGLIYYGVRFDAVLFNKIEKFSG